MAALTANSNSLVFEQPSDKRRYGVVALGTIYKGAIVGKNPAGYLKAFEPGDEFVGFAAEYANNSAGTAGDTAIIDTSTGLETKRGNCDVFTSGVVKCTFASVALGDVMNPAFATTSNVADCSLTGHPDAFIGRIVERLSSTTAMVQIRAAGEIAENGVGSQLIVSNFDFPFAAVLTAGAEAFRDNFRLDAIGAGIVAGGIAPVQGVNGGVSMLLDNDSEAENLTIETNAIFPITGGITFESQLTLQTAGGAATDDLDFGLMTAASSAITDAIRANMAITTAGIKCALFHIDASALDIEVTSDDDSAVVGETDTTSNIVTGTYDDFKIIARAGGVVEFWVNKVRQLASTAFSVSATGVFAAIINLEKSTGTGVPEVRVRRIRVAGSR